MNKDQYSQTLLPFLWGSVFIVGIFYSTALIGFDFTDQISTPTSTPQVATREQLLNAQVEWELSAHADTFDDGMGANTTCARCKSPKNWDPAQTLAAQEALDCGSCKRIPGASRPELESGVPVTQDDWKNIRCDICHIPVGDSYYTYVAYWDQFSRTYTPIQAVNDLCAKCHEGRHGFEVVEEQTASDVHQAWDCTRCHGAHGEPSSCIDCHDAEEGSGAFEHARHTSVNCTACHDQGGLSIWQERDPDSKNFGSYTTRRFAHTLTSWPSHDLSKEVSCVKCHHPKDFDSAVLVQEIGCQKCHLDGAVLFWCINFPHNPEPDPNYPK